MSWVFCNSGVLFHNFLSNLFVGNGLKFLKNFFGLFVHVLHDFKVLLSFNLIKFLKFLWGRFDMGLLLVEIGSNIVSCLFKVSLENIILRFLLIGSVLYEFKQYVKGRLAYRLLHEICIISFHEIFDKRWPEYFSESIQQNFQWQRSEIFLLKHFLYVVDNKVVEND